MVEESVGALAEAIKLVEEIRVGNEFREMLSGRNFVKIFFAGLGVIADYSDALKDADVAWRKANAELASRFPA